MSLINEKIKQPDLNTLNILLEQLLQNILSIAFLSDQQRNIIMEQFRQLEVLLTLYLHREEGDNSTDKIDLKNFNDREIEEKIAQLIAEIKSVCYQFKQGDLSLQCNEWYLAYHLWRISLHGVIYLLEPVVNSIAEIANSLRVLEDITFMHSCIQHILNGVSSEYKNDMLDSDPQRPWRVLLLNYGIVATRSHNSQLIERSYDYFYQHLPEDAAQFFTEAMSQMVVQNYPQSVRNIVEKYYQKYAINQLYKNKTH